MHSALQLWSSKTQNIKSEVSTSFLKASASSSFITHFTYKCNLSNQFCFQDSHLFPSLCPHFYKMLMWVETAFPKMHISALSSSVTDVHILRANLAALSQTVSKGKKPEYQIPTFWSGWPSSGLLKGFKERGSRDKINYPCSRFCLIRIKCARLRPSSTSNRKGKTLSNCKVTCKNIACRIGLTLWPK